MTPTVSPTDFAPEPPPMPRPRFVLSRTALGVLAVCGSVHLLYIVQRLRSAPQLVAQDLGVFALGFLLSMGFATLAWRLDPRRRAGNVVFCCLLLLFTLSRVVEAIELAAKLPNRPQDAAADPRAAGLKVKAVTDRVMHDFQGKMQAYNLASAELKTAGMIDASRLDSREAIARRRALVKSYGEANDTFTEACRTLEQTLHAELVRAVPEALARQGTAAVMEGFDMPLVLRIRDCERRAALLLDGVLNVYDVEFPRWHVNADHRVVFDDPAAAAREHRWGQQLQAVMGEERVIQQEKNARKSARLAATASPPASPNPVPASTAAPRE